MIRKTALIIALLGITAAGYGAESMLDYFKGRLPATAPAKTDKIPIMQGNGSAIRMIGPDALRPLFGNSTTAWNNITGKPSVFSPSVHNSSHAANGTDPLTVTSGQVTGLASVATSGSYADLSNQPTIPSAAADITYTHPTYTTVGAALDQLLYVPISISSYTMSGSSSNVTQEIGSSYTLTGSGLVWSTNKAATTQTVNSVARTSPYMPSPSTVSSNTTYTLYVSDGTTNASSSRTVTFSPRRYWAPTTIPLASLTSANVIALAGSEYSSSHSKSGTTYNCTGGRYPTFAFVATAGTLTATTVGGLGFSDYSYRTISVTNASGYTQNYYVYQFNSLQSGSNIVVNWD